MPHHQSTDDLTPAEPITKGGPLFAISPTITSKKILHNLDFASDAKGPTSLPPFLPKITTAKKTSFSRGRFNHLSIVAHFYWNRKPKVDQTFPAWIEVESRSLRGASMRLADLTFNCTGAILYDFANRFFFIDFVDFCETKICILRKDLPIDLVSRQHCRIWLGKNTL